MRGKKWLLVVLLAALIVAFASFGGHELLTLDSLQRHQAALAQWIADHTLLAVAGFIVIYITVTALSLPGATIMTLAGGAFFGNIVGFLAVSVASTVGATLAFLAARFLLRDILRKRYADTVARMDRGIAKDGAFYLATLRLVPLFPFFVINLAMGLTGMKLRTYALVTWAAMLPATFVYVNAGTQLAQIQALGDIVSVSVLLAFGLLALCPLIAKVVMGALRRRRLYRNFTKPDAFDYNLVVIGAGSAGLVSAYIAAAVKAKVVLIEKHQMGGDCLNTGCVPSKALIKSANVADTLRNAQRYGLESVPVKGSFTKIMGRVKRVIAQVEPHDSVERYRKLGVDCLAGEARFISPWEVEVCSDDGQSQRITGRSIIIASGGRPVMPPIPGLTEMNPLTSENLWALETRPKRLLVLGGGAIGSELAHAFVRLGSQVVLVVRGERVLAKEDIEVSDFIMARFRDDGIDLRLNHSADSFRLESGEKVLYCSHQGEQVRIAFDEVLIAVGRAGNTDKLNLQALGIEPADNGTIAVEDDLSAGFPNVFACGDVAGPYQLTHAASHQAWYAAVNGLFGQFKRFRVDYRVMPQVIFTSPEVARVGLSENEARARKVAYEVTRYELGDLDRAIAESEDYGFIKVLTPPGKDKILGAVVVGVHAGEILSEFTLAMKHGLGLNKILGTIHPYPTWTEAAKSISGEWRRAHAPAGMLAVLERMHSWRRGKAKTTPSNKTSWTPE